jgi:hypothetical protein
LAESIGFILFIRCDRYLAKFMQTNPCYATTCHNCRFFQPEGHHYGNCDRMHIIVEGEWPACHLALPAFNSLGQQLGTSIEESIDRQNLLSKDLLDRLSQIMIEATD